MALDFPSSPTVGQVANGYTWDGTAWINASTRQLFGVAFDGTIAESRAANAVTFAVKNSAGADPSSSAPVLFWFPNGLGGIVSIAVTAPLSITVPAGATLGTSSGLGCRIWIAAFNDAGTVRLAVRSCSTSGGANPSLVAPPENSPASTTLTPGNNVHTFYTTGAAVASKYWAWIAFATYESGLATAGQWAVAPTIIALINASTPRPGQTVQKVWTLAAGSVSISSGTAVADITGAATTINLLSAANMTRFSFDGTIYLRAAAANQQGNISTWRDAVNITALGITVYSAGTADLIGSFHAASMDKPNSTAGTTYKARAANALSSGLVQYTAGNLMVEEFMG